MCDGFSGSESLGQQQVERTGSSSLFRCAGGVTMPGIDFASLRRQVPLAQVLELVGFTALGRCGAQVRGPCPLHGSSASSASSRRSRAFAAHLERHCWHCFGCGAGGNALDLYAAVTRLPLYAAALELCARLHLPVPWLRVAVPARPALRSRP